jgi:hypothetical protein
MGSWERDIGASNAVTGDRVENKKEKNIFSFGFQATVFII